MADQDSEILKTLLADCRRKLLSGRFVPDLDCENWPPNRHEIFDDVSPGFALTATASNILAKSGVVILSQPTTLRDSHISNIVPEKSGKESDIFYYYN